MTDRELNELLNGVEPPPRDARYWKSFSKRVQARLKSHEPASATLVPKRFEFQLWKLGFATIGAAVIFLLLHLTRTTAERNQDLRVLRTCYSETAGLFSGRLKALRIES